MDNYTPDTEPVSKERQTIENENQIVILTKHLAWLEELQEAGYVNQFSMKDGITRVKSLLFDCLSKREYLKDL